MKTIAFSLIFATAALFSGCATTTSRCSTKDKSCKAPAKSEAYGTANRMAQKQHCSTPAKKR